MTEGEVCVVTGASSGIGRAIAVALAERGARVVCADIDGARDVAEETGETAVRCDVSSDDEIGALIDAAEAIGPIRLCVSNAGVLVTGGMDAPDADWERAWSVNALSHVRIARRLVPLMEPRGGHLAITASAAGLLTQVGAAPYAVSKHAAVAIAEWIAVSHPGIGVSVLCPQAVRTRMTAGGAGTAGMDGIMEPAEVAGIWLEGIEAGTLRILPHPQVAEYARRRAEDPDRWVRGMRRLAGGAPTPKETA